ncbi:TolC family protein [Dinghuibacter silviterrae]|uniref:Outer membrane protein n=1 Tax=Dinghuibacter silviterrae TaxID=1539049 RepID=A0A4R8DRH0_9BACT|nr:TolC family protein [Dinghuibacter silviterrae]TDX00015.1 outer membrane protein [Dinghuibacter silviterrae]
MIPHRLPAILLGWGLCLAHPSRAQDSTVWDLKTCLTYARDNNITISSARLNVETGQQELLLSKAAKLPNLYGSTSQTYTHSKNANPVVGGFQTQSSFASDYSATSGMTLYQGGYLNDVVRQNQLIVKSDNLAVIEDIANIDVQITAAYLNILLAKETIVYEKDLVTTSEAQVKQAQQEYDAGSIAKVNLAQLQAQLATDQYTLVTGQSNLRQALLNLKVLLQLPYGTTFDIATPKDTLMATALVPSLDSAQQAAYRTRPEIQIGQMGVQSARLDLAKARAGYYPTLKANAELSTGFSNNSKDAYFQQLDDNFFQEIGVTLSIPIFANRINRTNVENARIEIRQQELNLKSATTALSQTVEQYYINVVNAQGQYNAAVDQLRYTEESYRIATEELKVGATNTVQFLQQKNAYIQALQAYVQAKYNAVLDVKIYDFYTGAPINLN